jgi:hypothetical protein
LDLVFGSATGQQSWQSSHVKINAGGSLQYIPDSMGNTIPDFSAVGYYRGQEKIPRVPVLKTLYPSGEMIPR